MICIETGKLKECMALLWGLTLLSCSKSMESKSYIKEYPPLLLNIADSQHRIDLRSVQLYWFEKGRKTFPGATDSFRVTFPPIGYDTIEGDFIRDSLRPLFSSFEFFRISEERGVRAFYLDYGMSGSDTLAVHVDNETRTIIFKGQGLPIDSTFVNDYLHVPVYLLKRN